MLVHDDTIDGGNFLTFFRLSGRGRYAIETAFTWLQSLICVGVKSLLFRRSKDNKASVCDRCYLSLAAEIFDLHAHHSEMHLRSTDDYRLITITSGSVEKPLQAHGFRQMSPKHVVRIRIEIYRYRHFKQRRTVSGVNLS